MSAVQTHTKARVGGDDEGHGRSEAARRPHVVEQGPERDGAGVAHAVPWVVPVHVAGGLLGLVHLRVPPHRVLHGARLGRGGVPGGALHGQRRRRGGWPAAVRVRRAGALRGGGGELVVEHAGAGRARDRVGAPAARAVQPAGVRAGRGDAAVARAEPRRAHGVPGREPLLRGAPGREAPGAGGLRRGLRHGGARAPGPPRRRPRRARRRVPPRPEPALLRVPPRHQRPPQPALRRRLGRHPRRRPARVHGGVAGEDVGDLLGGGDGADQGHGDGGDGARLRAGGGARVRPGVPVRRERGRGDQHAVARSLPRARRRRRQPGSLLRAARRSEIEIELSDE